MRQKHLLVLLLGVLWLLPAVVTAAPAVPAHQGYVTDQAGLLSAAAKQQLEQALQAFEQSDSTQIAVLTVDSLDGDTVESYALRVAEAWGIGQKGRDNGALLLVSKADHKVHIEVGYGLEGRLTDLLAGRIIRQEIVPSFRRGDYDQGITAGVAAMMQAVRGEYHASARKKKSSDDFGVLFMLFFLAPMLFRVLPGTRRRMGMGGFWIGGGGFGGGFGGGSGGGFSGGGGGFGGGGASGGW